MHMKIGERIRKIREYREVSQDDLATDIVSKAHLSRIERGESEPSQQLLEYAVQKLNVSMDFLIGESLDEDAERISCIYDSYFQTKNLSLEEEEFLNLQTVNVYSQEVMVKLYAILMQYSASNGFEKQAENSFKKSENVIPEQEGDKYKLEYFRYYKACGSYFYTIQLPYKADSYFTYAYNLMPNENSIEVIELYYQIGLIKENIVKDYRVCLSYSKRAYVSLKEMNDPPKKALVTVFNTLGVQYRLAGKCEKAMKYIEEGLTLVDSIEGNEELKYSLITNKGRIYQQMKYYDSAIAIFTKQMETEDYPGVLYAIRGLLEVYLEQKKFELIKKHLPEAIEMSSFHKRNQLYIEFRIIKLRMYQALQDNRAYEREIQQIIEHSIKLGRINSVISLSRRFAEYLVEIGATKRAIKYYQIYAEYVDKAEQQQILM